jgi:hypothetical protein
LNINWYFYPLSAQNVSLLRPDCAWARTDRGLSREFAWDGGKLEVLTRIKSALSSPPTPLCSVSSACSNPPVAKPSINGCYFAHSFRRRNRPGMAASGRLDAFAAPFGYDCYLRIRDGSHRCRLPIGRQADLLHLVSGPLGEAKIFRGEVRSEPQLNAVTGGGDHDPFVASIFGQYRRKFIVKAPLFGAGNQFDSLSLPGDSRCM